MLYKVVSVPVYFDIITPLRSQVSSCHVAPSHQWPHWKGKTRSKTHKHGDGLTYRSPMNSKFSRHKHLLLTTQLELALPASAIDIYHVVVMSHSLLVLVLARASRSPIRHQHIRGDQFNFACHICIFHQITVCHHCRQGRPKTQLDLALLNIAVLKMHTDDDPS